ncbi:MAG: hypothetical protein ACJA16_000573 [Akkermansiaceae bacterium]
MAVDGVARDVVENSLMVFLGRRLDDGEVELGGLSVGELADEMLECRVGFGGDDATRGVLVEAVDDAGAAFTTLTCELASALMEEGIDEGSVRIAGGGMNNHAGIFIDDNYIWVFVENGEGQVLGFRFYRFFLGDFDGDGIAGFQRGAGFDFCLIEEDVAVLDECLNSGPRKVHKFAGEEGVEPLAGCL